MSNKNLEKMLIIVYCYIIRNNFVENKNRNVPLLYFFYLAKYYFLNITLCTYFYCRYIYILRNIFKYNYETICLSSSSFTCHNNNDKCKRNNYY